MCRNFTVKFGTLSQPGKSGLVSSENRFKASQRTDSYGTILADLCRAVGVKVVQNLKLFPDRMPVHFLCSKNSKFRGIIRSAIGSKSAVSQTPSKQSIHLCIKTAAPNSIRQQSFSQECSCRFLSVEKILPQVFEICCQIRTKMILRASSGKNSDSEKNSPISRTSSLCSCGSRSNEHT